MSDYIIVDGELHRCDNDELCHYGIKGMRWGVRRAIKKLAKASTQEQRDKAVSSLKKHREKGAAEVAKLKKKTPELERKYRDKSTAINEKAAKLRRQAAKKERSAYGVFTGRERAERRLYEARKLNARAAELESNVNKAKAALENNKALIQAFRTEIKNIDQTLVEAGKRYVSA